MSSSEGNIGHIMTLLRSLSNKSEVVSPTSPTDSYSTNTDLDEHDLGDQDPFDSPHKSLFSGLPAVSDGTSFFRKVFTETWTLDPSKKDTPFFSITPTLRVTKDDVSNEAPTEGQQEAMKRMESKADSWLFDRKRTLTHLLAETKRKSEEAKELARRKELGQEDEPWMSDEVWSEKVVENIEGSMNERSKWLESVEKELTEVGISVEWQAGIAFKDDTGEEMAEEEGPSISSTSRPLLRRS